MSKSTQKIVAGLLSFAMVLTLVVGLAAAPAGAQTVSFTRNLTVGSTGADVTRLQTILQEKGFFTVEPTGYFGSVTKRAVAAWQASEGISPAAGYFGPISRAQIGQGGVVTTTPGCPAGALFNTTTGAPCTPGTTSTVPGCSTGDLFSRTTGQSCAGGTTPVTSGSEGSLTVTQSAAPSNNPTVLANTDVPVYGLDLKAQLGDVRVDRIDLAVSVLNTSDSSYENPGNFVNAIKILDGSTVLKSWSVGTGDFLVGTTTNTYYIRLSGIGLVVPKDTTKTLTIQMSTNGGIDQNRTLSLYGYGTNSLLAVSGNNITSYYDVSALNRTHTFQKPGTSTLSISADASNPIAATNRVDTTANGAPEVTMLVAAAKSVTGDSKITSLTVRASTTIIAPTSIFLYDGSTRVAALSVASSTVQNITFSNLAIAVAKDTTKALTIKASFPTGTTNGTYASTSITSTTYQKPNGSSATLTTWVNGNDQYFYSTTPNWTFLSGTISAPINTVTGTTSSLNGKFTLKVKPVGGSMTVPTINSFYVNVASSSSALHITSPAAVTVSGNPTTLSENNEYTVTVDVTSPAGSHQGVASANTAMWFTLSGATSTIDSNVIQQTWGLGSFKTDSIIPNF